MRGVFESVAGPPAVEQRDSRELPLRRRIGTGAGLERGRQQVFPSGRAQNTKILCGAQRPAPRQWRGAVVVDN